MGAAGDGVGEGDGVGMGEGVGVKVGRGLGVGVGEGDGHGVGVGVGEEVGDGLGLGVGDCVGVGEREGTGVGSGVGVGVVTGVVSGISPSVPSLALLNRERDDCVIAGLITLVKHIVITIKVPIARQLHVPFSVILFVFFINKMFLNINLYDNKKFSIHFFFFTKKKTCAKRKTCKFFW